MNQDLVTKIKTLLNEVEAIHTCVVKIEEHRGQMTLTLEGVNSTNKRFRTDKFIHFSLYTTFRDALSVREPEAQQFLMETNLKIQDIILLDTFLRNTMLYRWEVGEFIYKRENLVKSIT